MDFLAISQFQGAFQLILAGALGMVIGIEREHKRKAAGFQTFPLVSLGACLFAIIGFELFNFFTTKPGISSDPSRIIQAVAIGIGFIGAGVIFHREKYIEGLTTAAGLWITAAIGIAVGCQLYFLAIFSTFLTAIILIGLGEIEKRFFK